MKAYISAEMRVVRMKNNIIATSVTKNDTVGNQQQLGPTRKSIWE